MTRLVFVGCWRWRETPAKHQVSHSAPMNGQWLSINLPCQLVSQPATNYNVHLKAIWSLQLTHSSAWPHLQPRLKEFPKERPGEDGFKILNLREPMTSSAKYCLEHSRWVMVFISVPWWLIYLVDGLFISQPRQTCVWVAGGKFGGILSCAVVAQPCSSPSASWPRRVIRT